MSKQKKYNKIKLPPFMEEAKITVVRFAYAFVSIVVIIFLLASVVKMFVAKSGYFNLREVRIISSSDPGSSGQPVSREILNIYRGKNIFDVDLDRVYRIVKAKYPDSKDIRAQRSMPDNISIYISVRKPVAFVGDVGGYVVDEEGVIFSIPQGTSQARMPVITGVDPRSYYRLSAAKSPISLRTAVDLIREMKASKFLNNYNVTRVNASDIRELSFLIDGDLEIRIGFENIRKKLGLLRNTLRDPRLVKGKIKYIDVRFDDIVIGPK